VKILVTIVFDALAVAIFILLTQPIDLRPGRWVRIALSMLPVTFVGQILIGAGLPGTQIGGMALIIWLFANIGVLALLWSGPIASFAAHGVIRLLDPEFHEARLTRADFSSAMKHRNEGEINDALAATRKELEKDPSNYEGLILLAQLYEDLNMPAEALKQVDIILANPNATDAQKEVARAEREACAGLAQHLQAMELYRKHTGQ
jgi:tetratricopeptide (TPR) repeat protein